MTDTKQQTDRVRLDKWLWAARFFKTRSQASTAVKGGHVHLNGQRAKPSVNVSSGDRLRVTKGPVNFVVDVTGLADKRGPATVAQTLYAETQDSITRREADAEARRLARMSTPQPDRRPDKRQRRKLRQFKQDG